MKIKRLIFIVLVFFIVVFALLLLSFELNVFSINYININGRINKSALSRLKSAFMGKNLLLLTKRDVLKILSPSITDPLVKDIDIVKKLPDTLVLELKYRNWLANVVFNSNNYILGSDMVLFKLKKPLPNVPTIFIFAKDMSINNSIFTSIFRAILFIRDKYPHLYKDIATIIYYPSFNFPLPYCKITFRKEDINVVVNIIDLHSEKKIKKILWVLKSKKKSDYKIADIRYEYVLFKRG